jgi:hypothetical protein
MEHFVSEMIRLGLGNKTQTINDIIVRPSPPFSLSRLTSRLQAELKTPFRELRSLYSVRRSLLL